VIAQSASPARPLLAISAIVAIGVLVALVTVLMLTAMRPVVIALYFAGFAGSLPTLVVRDKRAYWLFLLILSIPIDISKPLTTWLVDSWSLLREYGLPPLETLSLDIYLTDVVLAAMLLPWVARLCLRRDCLYFPKIGYIAVLYFAYSFVDSFRAVSFYLAIFEWCREVLYFLSFVYLANNVSTRSQLRAVILALIVGLVIESGTVITFYHLNIGTETPLFSQLNNRHTNGAKLSTSQTTLYEGEAGAKAQIKRSAGTFGHPALAAYYLEFILPIVLGYLVTVRYTRDRILLGAILAEGWLALYLTFARSGLVGAIVGTCIFFAVARWSRLISRNAFSWSVFIFAMCAVVAAPKVIGSLWSRPEAAYYRLGLIEKGMDAFWQRPILGAGLNNGSAVLEGARRVVDVGGERQAAFYKLHNHYLVVLVEDGLIGFLLFFTFFWQIVMTAFRSMRAAETEMKLVLVGMVAALGSIAIHNLGDAFQGHVTSAMLWLYAGLIVAISRRVQAECAPPPPGRSTLITTS
jgi:hypothetical protein